MTGEWRVKHPEPEWVVSTGFAVLRPKREYIEPRYLYACVFDKEFTDFLVQREKGAAYPAVLPEDIADAVISLPPLAEQRAIAHILGALDDKIELNRRMSETLEAIALALFKAWFVDFEPVRAKLERVAGGAGTRSLDCPPTSTTTSPTASSNQNWGRSPKGGRLSDSLKWWKLILRAHYARSRLPHTLTCRACRLVGMSPAMLWSAPTPLGHALPTAIRYWLESHLAWKTVKQPLWIFCRLKEWVGVRRSSLCCVPSLLCHLSLGIAWLAIQDFESLPSKT
jgi:hypothetical protein